MQLLYIHICGMHLPAHSVDARFPPPPPPPKLNFRYFYPGSGNCATRSFVGEAAVFTWQTMARPCALRRRSARSRVSCVLFVVAARGLCPASSFCPRMSPVTRTRPWEARLRGAGGAAVAGRGASSVVMQIHPEGGQSPCNIKVRMAAANGRDKVWCAKAFGLFFW